MKNIPNVGFICVGNTALELSGAICCAGRLMKLFRGSGYDIGGCYSCMCPSLQRQNLKRKLKEMCAINQLVVTVGGEGWKSSDIMPDITDEVCTRSADFFAIKLSCAESSQAFCGTGAKKFPLEEYAGSSRATAGFCGQSLVINLPDDAVLARKRLMSVLPAVSFAVSSFSGTEPQNAEDILAFFGNHSAV